MKSSMTFIQSNGYMYKEIDLILNKYGDAFYRYMMTRQL